MRTARYRRVVTATAISMASVALPALAVRRIIMVQAKVARDAIGKPLGEDPHLADKQYKKHYGQPLDLLLLGDSIAAGLGAEKPKHTLGAQLATMMAKRAKRTVSLHTAARVGSESSMLHEQLASLPPDYKADIAVIVVGGNDVTHRIKTSKSTGHLGEVVGELISRGTAVVVGTCPDLGALSPVPQPLRSLGRRASRQLADAQRDVVTELGGRAVSLADVVGPFFVAQPDQMFALDRFHPSSAGYRRTAKAILPSVLVALGLEDQVPFGHHEPKATDSSK